MGKTKEVCPHCKIGKVQDSWCAFCGTFYTKQDEEKFNAEYNEVKEKFDRLIELLRYYKECNPDFWCDEAEEIMLRPVELMIDTCYSINGFCVGDLLEAISKAISNEAE